MIRFWEASILTRLGKAEKRRRLGKAVYTAAGTTITRDVPDYALAIDRGVVKIKEGYSLTKLKKRLEKA